MEPRYQYTKKPRSKIPISTAKPKFAQTLEVLSGFVKGMDAAKGEERFARALDKAGREYRFRMNPTDVPTGQPGWLELDFLVKSGFGYRAFEVDGMEFVHRGQRKAAEATLKDLRRVKGLQSRGIFIREIEHIDEALLQTQEDADQLVRRMMI